MVFKGSAKVQEIEGKKVARFASPATFQGHTFAIDFSRQIQRIIAEIEEDTMDDALKLSSTFVQQLLAVSHNWWKFDLAI